MRTLDDDRAIHANPLIRTLAAETHGVGGDAGDVAVFVRREVNRTVAESLDGASPFLSGRAARILARCDGAGESHGAVMRDMAISRAEFYRQLAAGRQGLALALQRLVLPPQRRELSPLDLRMQGAFILAHTGRLDDAVAYLAPMLEDIKGVEVVRAACALAEFRMDANHVQEARRFANVASMAAKALSGYAAEVAEAKVVFVDCSIAMMYDGTGNVAGKRKIAERLAHLRTIAQTDETFAADTVAELSVLEATLEAYLGRFDTAVALLQVSPANDPAATVAPKIRGELLMRLSSIRMLLPESLDHALADCRTLLRYAASHGLQRMVTAALADRAVIAAMKDDIAEANRYAGDAVASSRAFLVPMDHAGICTMAASVALDTGRPQDARAFAREARRFCGEESFPALLSWILDADALRAQGEPEKALRSVERLETLPAARAFSLVTGRALYVKSRAHHVRGDNTRALAAARDSIDILQGSGHRHALLKSLALADALSPDARVHRRFEDLRATF